MPNGKYRLDDTRENQEKDSGLQADSNANQYDYRARPVGEVYSDGYNGRKPGVSLISLDKVLGSDGSYWRIAHNFDYYKDLPPLVPSKANGGPDDGQNKKMHMINKSSSSGKIPNYIEDPDFEYFIIQKDMVWQCKDDINTRTLETHNWKNQGIIEWSKSDSNGGGSSAGFLGMGGNLSSGNGAIYTVWNSRFEPVFKYSKNVDLYRTTYTIKSKPYESTTICYQDYDTNLVRTYNNYIQFPYIYLYYRDSDEKHVNEYCVDISRKINHFPSTSSSITEQECVIGATYDHTEGSEFGSGSVYNYEKGNLKEGYSESLYYLYTTDKKTVNTWLGTSEVSESYQKLKYPTKEENDFAKPRVANGGYGYLYVDYISISPYVISSSDLKNNSNYVVKGLYSECSGEHSDGGWSGAFGGHHTERSSYTIKPTLMHEHVVPCICPDSTPVSGWDKKDIGTVNVRYTLAKGGQTTGDGANIKSIPVKITKRNCEAYQSNKWKSKEVKDAYNSNKKYTYYVKQ